MNKSDSPASTIEFLSGGGEMGAAIRQKDWSKTALGSARFWPQSLRTAISIMLETHFPMYIAWGKDFVQFYNDGYRPILGATKHPALGKSSKETFKEIWEIIGPMFEGVMRGEAVGVTDFLLPLHRYGYTEECYFIFSYSPIRDESGSVGGVLVTVTETSKRVIEERRKETLRYMAKRAAEVKTVEQAWQKIKLTIEANDLDIPFALCYAMDPGRKTARLTGNINLTGRSDIPASFSIENIPAPWISLKVITDQKSDHLRDISTYFPGLKAGPWPENITNAYLVPLNRPEKTYPYGFMILGVSARKAFDEDYKTFFDLFANHAATAVANAHAFEVEKKRSQELLATDKMKTDFFNNISHEFRTPLTLMLGSLEDLLSDTGSSLEPQAHKNIEITYRNALRLLRMVNTLLDFSSIEAGRMQAQFQPTDVAAFTKHIASNFRSAIEKAGIRFTVQSWSADEPTYIDPEMWEKIVSNLLSNALKYTLEGEIQVSVFQESDMLVMKVTDTGVGIAEAELPNVFNRFHRGKNAVGRSNEGTGIGLSLVNELVKMHKGTITIESTEGKGSSFTVKIPLGTDHLSPLQITGEGSAEVSGLPGIYLKELESLLQLNGTPAQAESPQEGDARRIMVVDDNADMRDYLKKILGRTYIVETSENGKEAVQRITKSPPDLIISDVMMPVMDGFEVLKAIKSNPVLARIPVVVISARAGEDTMMEGYDTGADDYLIKPFSAKELHARIRSQLKVANTHKHIERQLTNLFLQAPIALAILRGQEYVVEVANERILEIWGKKAEDVMNKPVFEALPEARGQGFEKLLHKVFKTGKRFIAQELPLFITRNGEKHSIYVKFVYEALREEDGTISGLMVLADDVTELVASRKKVEEYDNQLRDIIRQAPVAMAIYQGPKFIIEVANEKALEFWGKTAEQVMHKPLFEAMPEMHEQGLERILNDVFTRGVGFHATEHQINLPREGEMKESYVSFALEPIRNFDGDIISVMIIASDITELVMARKKIEHSESRQKLAIDAAEMGTFDLDLVTDKLIHNDRMALIFGMDPLHARNVPASYFPKAIHPDDMEIRSKAMLDAWKTGHLSYEARVVWPDNSIHWIRVMGKVSFNEHRFPLRIYGTVMEITERKELEQQKDDFMGIVSHELKTPVTSMKGYIQMLEEEFLKKGDRESAHHLNKVDTQIDKLSNLINDLLDITKIESGKMEFNYEKFDFDQLVDEVVMSMQFISSRHHLRRTGGCNKIVYGDKNRIEQVIINLVSNATKYSPNADEVHINTTFDEGKVVFSVKDYGMGISASDINKVFDRFFRASTLTYKSGGLGLGLYISAEIIKRQGGEIWAESVPGKGSVFYFSLNV